MRTLPLSLVLLALAPPAHAICRVVESEGTAAPLVYPDQAILFVVHDDLPLGEPCPEAPEPGEPAAGGETADSAVPSDTAPAGDTDRADSDRRDDAADDTDACVQPHGPAVTLVAQPRFQAGPDGASFALLMVTPGHPAVDVEDPDLFVDLAGLTRPRVERRTVEVEDPSLGYQCSDPKWVSGGSYGGGCGLSSGSGGHWEYPEPDTDVVVPVEESDGPDDTEVGSIETVGPYEVALLDAPTTAVVGTWLEHHGYAHRAEDLAALAPYVELGWTVVAVRVAVDGFEDAALDPLSFTWAGTELRIPLGVSRTEQDSVSELTVYVRGTAAWDFPGGDLRYRMPTRSGGDSGWLVREELEVHAAAGAEADPVAVPLAPEATESFQEVEVVERVVRIPSSECPSDSSSTSSSSSYDRDTAVAICGCTTPVGAGPRLAGLGLVLGWATRRRRSGR